LIRYHGKLLLFGEYTILRGSQGLALPLDLFSGIWSKEGEDPAPGILNEITDFLFENDFPFELDIDRFKKDVSQGWHFNSTIPFGYGAGSSGALTAGIYDRYVEKKAVDLIVLKKELGSIESFFHGASSGIDPLICYLNESVLLKGKTNLEIVKNIPDFSDRFFLIDTGISRKTAPLVNIFLEKSKDPNYRNRCDAELIPAVDEAIAAFLAADFALLFEQWHEISFFQYKYFQEMIPTPFRQVWLDGLAGSDYKLKLCGAGGGGFILGMGDLEKCNAANILKI